MVQYITWLRVLATCLITNSHYTGIYPTDLIANGGLIGDIIFFAVSRYCLYNIRLPFGIWYVKRLIRIYIPVWIGTLIILITGGYDFASKSLLGWFIYPTAYHFVASIILLYVPYYLVVKSDKLRNKIPSLMIFLAIIMCMVYMFAYDKSYYHIDNVREPFIRFLFFESMLLGALFQQRESRNIYQFSIFELIKCICVFILYFASKLIFAKIETLSEYQLINQCLIFLLLFYILKVFSGLKEKFENLCVPVKSIAKIIADMTLEIYIVQYVIIEKLRDVAVFPINWFVVTATILMCAFVLKNISRVIVNKIKL